jgi:hypothetical protein
LIENGNVPMLVGVGNRARDDDADDLELLAIIARRVRSVTRQGRLLERYPVCYQATAWKAR